MYLVGVNLDEAVTLKANSIDISKDDLHIKGKSIVKFSNFGGLNDAANEEQRAKLIRSINKWINKKGV